MRSKLFIFLIGLGLFLSGVSAFIAYFYEPLRSVFFVIAVILFVSNLLLSQMAYGYYLYKKEAMLKQKEMQRCPACDKPIYISDKRCPYCGKTV